MASVQTLGTTSTLLSQHFLASLGDQVLMSGSRRQEVPRDGNCTIYRTVNSG